MKYINKLCLILVSIAVSQPAYSQTCNDNILASTPDSAFSVNNDGTVTHTGTGLMWKVCSEGQTWDNGSCLSAPTTYDWQQALQEPATLNVSGGYAGHTDWRVPNIKELMSILEVKCSNPPINENIFAATPASPYWSSSLKTDGFSTNLNYAWVIDLRSGLNLLDARSRGTNFPVLRLVRNSQ